VGGAGVREAKEAAGAGVRTGPRGKRQAIVGEELVRLRPGDPSDLYDVLACGHRQKGTFGRDGLPSTSGGMPVTTRICRQCKDGKPAGPVGEVLRSTMHEKP
jgi:hypothetical protein